MDERAKRWVAAVAVVLLVGVTGVVIGRGMKGDRQSPTVSSTSSSTFGTTPSSSSSVDSTVSSAVVEATTTVQAGRPGVVTSPPPAVTEPPVVTSLPVATTQLPTSSTVRRGPTSVRPGEPCSTEGSRSQEGYYCARGCPPGQALQWSYSKTIGCLNPPGSTTVQPLPTPLPVTPGP